MTSTFRRRLTRTCALAFALAALGAAAPSAQAGLLVSTATDCDTQVLEQPFLPWVDFASYTLDRGGSFESGAEGWSLSGASVVNGNEPWQVHGDGGSHSLRVPAGSSATSSSICVGLEHPTLRFFARGTGLLPLMVVEVKFEDAAGNIVSLPIGAVTGVGSWQPTLPLPVVANLLPVIDDAHTAVAFEVTALTGDWRIDDFYVDPRNK